MRKTFLITLLGISLILVGCKQNLNLESTYNNLDYNFSFERPVNIDIDKNEDTKTSLSLSFKIKNADPLDPFPNIGYLTVSNSETAGVIKKFKSFDQVTEEKQVQKNDILWNYLEKIGQSGTEEWHLYITGHDGNTYVVVFLYYHLEDYQDPQINAEGLKKIIPIKNSSNSATEIIENEVLSTFRFTN